MFYSNWKLFISNLDKFEAIKKGVLKIQKQERFKFRNIFGIKKKKKEKLSDNKVVKSYNKVSKIFSVYFLIPQYVKTN